MTLRLATRGSDLAMWQAREAADRFDGDAEPVVIEPAGDRDKSTDLARFGSIGIFTVEVDRAVLDGRADIGVHSLKDLTTTLHDGVVLAGVLARGPVEDVLVAKDGLTLDTLPTRARVGSGSLRRRAMLRSVRPDLDVVPIRGNVPTRIEKVTGGELDATILARAGVARLGLLDHVTEILPTELFLPAVGQAIVGLTCRADDAETAERVEVLARDADAWPRALAERSFLRAMKGGCNAPVGGHARIENGVLELRGRVLSLDGRSVVDGRIEGRVRDAESLALRLADDLATRGGRALVEAAREAASA